jgi:stage II sporulation protein AB (anti-sigma F factor)
MHKNEMKLEMGSDPRNEGLARVVISGFMTRTNPTLEEVADVKTAVSEAVTNSIIHAYGNREGDIIISSYIEDRTIYITVTDFGCGIADVKKAMEPMYTTGKENGRSGMGFSFMEAFMDDLKVESQLGQGTRVTMSKKIGVERRDIDGE